MDTGRNGSTGDNICSSSSNLESVECRDIGRRLLRRGKDEKDVEILEGVVSPDKIPPI